MEEKKQKKSLSETIKCELLAPAGGMNQLIAAVQNGADAVYIGGEFYNARINADNFSEEQLWEAIEYAHKRDVKVYVTMNTLLFDDEVLDGLKYAEKLYTMGVDALIVQDLGLGHLIFKHLPNLPLHLSTQGTVYNSSGAMAAKKLGFKRVVLARETPLTDVENIVSEAGVEIETFVHGALCMSYSGQCHMSRIIGGRSGNRGNCAQPCRLMYEDEKGNLGYFLSPKDLCTIERVGEIIETGVTSLKIEGRMKSPEYVATVVSIYRKYIDLYYEQRGKKARGTGKESFEKKGEEVSMEIAPKDMEALEQIFARGSFTEGFMMGKRNSTIESFLSGELSKHSGILAGEVINYALKEKLITYKATPGIDIEIGELIEVRTGKGLATGLVTFKEKNQIGDIKAKDSLGNTLPITEGNEIYKISDKKLMKEARASYENGERKKLPIRMEATVTIDRPMEIKGEYRAKNIAVTIVGERLVEKAINKPLGKERVISQLSKMGGTSFEGESIKCVIDEDAVIPISEINKLRRKLVERLEEKLIERKTEAPNIPYPDIKKEGEKFRASNKVHGDQEFEKNREGAITHKFSNITLGPEDKKIKSELSDMFSLSKKELGSQNDQGSMEEKSQDLCVEVNNLGWILEFSKAPVDIVAGPGTNITNIYSAIALRELGVKEFRKSYELEEGGDVPLMTTEYEIPQKFLVDRKGKKYRIEKLENGDKSVIKPQ